MNDLLQQLLTMGPALGAGVSGNGNAMQAFMEGYQRTMAQLSTQKRLQQQDSIATEDRERLITRQAEADTRAAEDQNWQRDQRNLSVAGSLNQAAAGAETPEQGEAAIDALYRLLSPQMQQQVAPGRDAAMRSVAGAVTARQKSELKRWVSDELLKSKFVVEAEGADPDITAALPARIRQLAESLTGKTAFRKSDMLMLTDTLEQAPPEKTRVPAAAGSMEEFSDPNITPERKAQILADRKAYMQSDDRAPRVTVNTGANDARINSRIDRLTTAFNTSPIVKEFNEVQAQHQTIAQIVKSQWSGPGDMSVVFAFMKALDPNSVVRETEYDNAAKSGNIFAGWAARFNGALNPNGGFLSERVKQDFLRTIEARMGVKRAQYDNLRKQTVQKIDRIKAGAPETGEEAVTDYGAAFPQEAPKEKPATPAQSAAPTNAQGKKAATKDERRIVNGSLHQWNGERWVPVKF